MRKLITFGVAFLTTTGALAQQQVSPSEKIVSATAPMAAEQCELRVFPTLEAKADTQTMAAGFGLLGALVDAAATKNQDAGDTAFLKEALAPPQQIKALSSFDLLAALRLPPSNVIFEEPLANPKTALKSTGRLTASNAPCYVELLVTQNFYTKSPVYGRSLNNRFILKDFRQGKAKASIRKGRGGNGLKVFPPETSYMTEEAEKDLHGAFAANLREFAATIKK
jgi:hypothetical protein